VNIHFRLGHYLSNNKHAFSKLAKYYYQVYDIGH